MGAFRKKIDSFIDKFNELELKLADPEIIKDKDNYQKIAKEHADLENAVMKAKELKKLERDINNLDDIIKGNDKDLAVYAQSEKSEMLEKTKALISEIKVFFTPGDKNDNKNVIMEIRAGTGGEEAALFAGDLFRMYTRFVERKNWKADIISANQTGLKGFKEVIFSIEGSFVYKHLKYERGVHRVQRVPVTEASGRIHTSAVTVAVLPEADEIDIEIKPEEIRLDTFCSSGKGGQSVNTTYSAVRITHMPTGIVVQCQDERSQLRNKQKAMMVLRSKLLDKAVSEQQDDISSNRKKQVGTGDRSEKIRTYNFPQNRVTDHRVNLTVHNLDSILDGELDKFIEKLHQAEHECNEN
ncbi:MAG: peptide chain release factor 1 [bacterium]